MTKEEWIKKVSNDGFLLKKAPEELRNDKDVVMAAISEQGYAFISASEELKNDKDVVMAAISQKGCVLQYTSERLRSDKEVVVAAIIQNPCAMEYASEDLKNDKEFLALYLAKEKQTRTILYVVLSERYKKIKIKDEEKWMNENIPVSNICRPQAKKF